MIRSLFLIPLLLHATLAQNLPDPQIPPVPIKKWSTLSGYEPLVIGRGGFSGLFPEGTPDAIEQLGDIGPFLCNLQITKEGGAFCVTGLTLDNSTTIALFDPKEKTYNIDGRDVQGHFSVDYTGAQIEQNISMNQAIFSRPSYYDGTSQVLNVDALMTGKQPPRFWLNVQNAAFYTQQGIKVVDIILELLSSYKIEFVSSSDIGFLKGISGKSNKATKVIFQLLHPMDIEPLTKQPYSAIVKDLVNIKSFATGIMVPKEYMWPVKPDKYLGLPTTLVVDAHKIGLEVYASGFANDYFTSYNNSYDPTAEYLQFIDKDSVDGVITDFPTTASNAIACFAHNNTLPKKGPTLIISNNGASGVYPGSTDLAYQQAIDDGADIIDCSVQSTKDGIAFCSSTADLITETTAVTKFMLRSSVVPEIQPKSGIYSFDLTWSEIQTLKPQMAYPQGNDFPRNPAYKNSGKFVTLPQFLELAKTKAVSGIMVTIRNAAYLASKKGVDIIGTVNSALSNATFDKQVKQQVFIQSDDSSVLSKFKDIPSYKRVLLIDEIIGDVPVQTVEEIKKYAEVVNLPKTSIVRTTQSLITGITNAVQELKDANLTVFTYTLRNEYVSLAFDYWSDPNMEIATYVQSVKVDGIITDFPATASRYLRSPCSDPKNENAILPAKIKGDGLAETIPVDLLPPTEAPLPPLQADNVVDPPLPPVANLTQADAPVAPPKPAPSSSVRACVSSVFSMVAISVLAMFFAGN